MWLLIIIFDCSFVFTYLLVKYVTWLLFIIDFCEPYDWCLFIYFNVKQYTFI